MPRPLSEQARQKTIEATQELVAEAGIGGFTIDAVAKRSGVAKSTIYRHWNSANELLVHAVDCQVERIPTPDTGTLRGDLLELYLTVAAIMDNPGMRQMMLDMMSAAAKDPELEVVKNAMVEERSRPVREIVRRAVERDEIPPIEPDDVLMLVEGPFLARTVMRADPIQRREIELAVAFIANGLSAKLSSL